RLNDPGHEEEEMAGRDVLTKWHEVHLAIDAALGAVRSNQKSCVVVFSGRSVNDLVAANQNRNLQISRQRSHLIRGIEIFAKRIRRRRFGPQHKAGTTRDSLATHIKVTC